MQRKPIESDAEVPSGLRDPEGHRVRAERVQAAPGAPAESGRLVAGHGVQIPRMDEFLPTGTVKDGVLGRFHVASMFRFDGFLRKPTFWNTAALVVMIAQSRGQPIANPSRQAATLRIGAGISLEPTGEIGPAPMAGCTRLPALGRAGLVVRAPATL